MKITMIRHEKVDMQWEKKYNSVSYDLACEQYDKSPIAASHKKYYNVDNNLRVYISELSRTFETACRLFRKTDFCQTSLINEVPLHSFCSTNKPYPLWLWNLAGRLQWFFQSRRQAESRTDTTARARAMINLLESRQEDCYLITHGFYMRILIRELKKKGYRIQKKKLPGISNLDMVSALKDFPHFSPTAHS